ncbi:hypothetical protein MTR67_042203 [Solanum verrucosum]|uniref:RNase H type-1 domain-containing protein n=1 Tax=Solanum verrucosum TaxID=315347 RepID=A0AAF0ULI4_SOLVR|nr:hypothetical protein MTR67_042203 [Solanum verrucosum]
MQNSGLAGYGGIVRDDKAELWAIYGGLIVAKNFNLKDVIIETDSHEELMLMSKGGVVDNHPDRYVIKECRCILSELGISMMHTLREGNSCADHLAKLGRMH